MTWPEHSLMDPYVVLPPRIDQDNVARLVRWIEQVERLELCYSSLPGAVDAIAGLTL